MCARLHAQHHRTTPPLCSALPLPHTPFAAHPPPPSSPATPAPLPLRRTRCLVSHAPSPPLRTQAPPRILLAYKTPPPAPSTPISLKAKHSRYNTLCQIASNSIFHSLAPKITMLRDSWVEDCCTWFIVFGFLQCMLVILFDRILQWEEQRERKRQ
jgi:hypothetical protein